MKSTCHERVVFRRIAKYHKLCSTDALPIACQSRSFFNYAAHHANGIHIDSGLRRADVYRRADKIRLCKRTRNGFNEFTIARTETLLDERTVAADKVYADRLGSTVKCFCVFYRIAAAYRNEHRDWSNADSLVYDGNTVFFRD